MVYINKKLVNEYVNEFFNDQYDQNDSWENNHKNLMEYYAENEFCPCSVGEKEWNKLDMLIKNNTKYNQIHKEWLQMRAIIRINDDF